MNAATERFIRLCEDLVGEMNRRAGDCRKQEY